METVKTRMLWQLDGGNLTWFMCDCFSSKILFCIIFLNEQQVGAHSDDVKPRLGSEQVNYISINSSQLIKSDSITRAHSAIRCNPVFTATEWEHCSFDLWNVIVRRKLCVFAINLPIDCKCGRFHPSEIMQNFSPPLILPTIAHLNFITVIPSESCDIDIHIWFDYTWKQIFVSDLRVGFAGGMNWVNSKNLDYVIRKPP